MVVWSDFRSGNADLYAQRVDRTGTAQLISSAVLVAGGARVQQVVNVLADGFGGAYVLWTESSADYDSQAVFVQRIEADATPAPGWAEQGVRISPWATYILGSEMCLATPSALVVGWCEYHPDTTVASASRIDASGTTLWGASGIRLSSGLTNLRFETAVPDSMGGAYVIWSGFNGAYSRIAWQHLNSAGVPLLAAGGYQPSGYDGSQRNVRALPFFNRGLIFAHDMYQPLSTTSWDVGYFIYVENGSSGATWVTVANGEQSLVDVAPDGQGGMYVLWVSGRDHIYGYQDLYLTRIRSGSSVVPGWPESGVLLTSYTFGTLTEYRSGYTLVPDGTNGVYVGYRGNYGFTVKRFTAAGALWPTWPPDGVTVDLNAFGSSGGVLDPSGGLYTAQDAFTPGGTNTVSVSRVDGFGKLGAPAPVIAQVRDVPNDQGGAIKVAWDASYLDSGPGYEVARYTVWRSVPPLAAAAALRAGATLVEAGTTPPTLQGDAHDRAIHTSMLMGETIYWEQVGEQTALAQSGYSRVISTVTDSTAGSNPRTLLMVVAHSGLTSAWFKSSPDSGYSVDNIAPSAPLHVTAQYVDGGANLQWSPGVESDLAGYRIFRGAAAEFAPGPSNFVATTAEDHFSCAPCAPAYFKVSAVDVHGNESPFVTVLPAGLLDAPVEPLRVLSFARPGPSPATVATELRFELPTEQSISLEAFDTAGRRVRLFAREKLPAGSHTMRWDLRDDAGRRLGSGLYFLRLQTEGSTLTRRLAISR